MHLTLLGLVTTALAGGAPEAPAPSNQVFAIRATTIVVGDGRVIEDGTLVVEGDLIRAVGADVDVPEGATVVDHDGFLTASLVAPHSTLLPSGERFDATDPFLAAAELRFGFDPERDEVGEALEHGVTTAVLTASSRAVIGGRTAVVQTHGGRVLEPRAHLSLSMNAAAVRDDEFPTSYGGLVRGLEQRFGSDADGPCAEARAGRLPVLIRVDEPHEIQRALAFAQAHELRGALLGARRAGEQLERLRESGLAVVFNPFDPGIDQRSLDAMVAVAGSDVDFAFALTDPRLLRYSAASLVRAGAAADRVWRALTVGGAAIAGVDDRVGSLARGRRADLCLWSGHPLDLTSALEAVYVGGERVAPENDRHAHGGAPHGSADAHHGGTDR